MADKTESVEQKNRVGILRKQNTSSVISNNSIKQRISAYRAKSKLDSNPSTSRSVDKGETLFSNRSKRDKPSTATASAPATPRIHDHRLAVSQCPSTTTLDSRRTATSYSSFSHKPGFIPAYLRNKTGTKKLVTAQLQSNKKQFSQVKKELGDLQSRAIECYKRYRESLLKLNTLNGNAEPPVIEEMQIISFKDKCTDLGTEFLLKPTTGKNKPTSPTTKDNTEIQLASNISFSKLKQITDEKILNDISQQVHVIQVHSFKLLQDFSDRLSLINNQMKLLENSAAGDTNLFPAKIQSLFEEIERKILEEEEQQNTRITGFMDNLKEVMINEQGTPVIMKECLTEEYQIQKRINERNINDLETKLKNLDAKMKQDEYKYAELTTSVANDKNTINELNTALAESQAKRIERDKEFEKFVLKLKQLELSNKRLEKQMEDKALEVIAKDKTILELKLSIKPMQDAVMKYTNQLQKFESKASRAEEEFKSQIDRLRAKYDEEVKTCNELRVQINDMNLGMADDCKIVREENMRLKTNEIVLMNDIESLKESLNEILNKTDCTEMSVMDETVLRREMERRDEEINRLKAIIIEMRDELIKREMLIAQKHREIRDVECLVKQLEKRDKINELQDEILRLQDLNGKQSKENDQLRIDLNKTDTALRLQEESLFMQQRLLKIRTELIHSLQENEDSTKNQIFDLHSEVEKRTNAVKQVKLNREVSSKSEELENLFSTLSQKNIEVKRQDHAIKLLEETHERNQKIRVKLEGKIARLESENAELKRFTKYK